MQMLTKFESKSSRAKSVAFHPKRPWILVSLHSSTIQLWDYRMGTIIDRFEGHGGPVRGVDFHKTQPLFASCGDDYTIKVWSLQTRKCLFTLTGHLDYTRTVFFHDDLPWLISCSDDQTIRIWNWQNRQEIACLTGHNHYVMSAQFHPTEDLIVSSSLDQTVRVWDISGLRKKHSAPTNSVNSFEDQLARANAPQQDVFGNTDAVVKYVLEGHDRGVNWASFHPTLPLIISAGDDRVLKLWRMSENKAWEVDTFRGHLNNILCCVFHPYQDLIVSVSEDKTIRTWDLNKRTPVQQFKRDSDKFWHVAVHPSMNLFAAAHDTGVMVFKLERERPASALHQNSLFYISKDKQLKHYDLAANENLALLSLKKQGSSWTPFRSLSYNPAERSVLATWRTENAGHYELMNLPRDSAGAIEPTNVIEGQGDQAVFISRNRFAVLNKKNQTIEIRDLNNSIVKSIATPVSTKDIIVAGPSQLMLVGATQVVIMDIQQKKEIAKMPIAGIKYVSWSNDGQYVALLGKHTVTIATKNLETVSSLHETIRIKSATWDESGVLLYSTLNHLKYCLLNGDNGILRTLPNTLYLVKARGSSVYTLTRAGTVEVVRVDPTEYRFKRALINKNFQEVLRIIKTSSLVGQSIISYLQKKGYPEVALQFVQDHQTKFDLALECGNLEVALEEAKALGKASAWRQLGQEALSQGNHDVVEEIYQKQHDFDRLSFTYLITGNVGRLQKMEQIAEHRSDYAARFQTSIFLNNIEQRIQLLREAGQDPLAYALAKSNGLTDIAEDIARTAGVEIAAIEAQTTDISQDTVPGVAHDTYSANWPLKQSVRSFFEQSLSGDFADLTLEAKDESPVEHVQGVTSADYVEVDNDGEDDGGWDMEVEDLGIDLKTNVAEAQAELSEPELWIRSSQVPADHIAAGSFESAAQLLNRQAGIANFAPLKSRFLEVYRCSKFYLEGNNELAPLKFNAKRFSSDSSHPQPLIPDLSGIKTKLDAAYKEFSLNKLELAVETFREVLYVAVTSAASTDDEAHFLGECVQICRNYILACSIELSRQKVQSNSQRSLELAAYMTIPKLDSRHAALPLLKATQLAITAKNFASASYFAEKILSLPKLREKHREKAIALKNVAGASALDEVEINFNRETNFSVCPATLMPIYEGEPFVQDPLTGAKYHASAKGSICRLTGISVVGQPGSGLKWRV